MSVSRRSSLVAALCVAMLAWGHGPAHLDFRTDSDDHREVARIRRHLERAERLLSTRDLSTLTAAQRAARACRVSELRAYREGGVFPHNHRLPDRRTPVFVDEHGTRCAMGYLIEQSGEEALVSRIAKARNLARIHDLTGVPELVAWLDCNGLTLAEAARIQPAYGGNDELGLVRGRSTVATAFSALGAGVGAFGIAVNLPTGATQNSRNTRGLLGVVCGLLGAGLGAPALSEDGAVRVLGALDIGLGIASFGFGIRQLDAVGEERSWAAPLAVAPVVWRDSEGTRRIALAVRF